MGFSKGKRFELGLGVFLGAFNVNMDGFLSFSTEEEEPITVMAKDGWHDGNEVKCFKSCLG